jgi:hypothetical protein
MSQKKVSKHFVIWLIGLCVIGFITTVFLLTGSLYWLIGDFLVLASIGACFWPGLWEP